MSRMREPTCQTSVPFFEEEAPAEEEAPEAPPFFAAGILRIFWAVKTSPPAHPAARPPAGPAKFNKPSIERVLP